MKTQTVTLFDTETTGFPKTPIETQPIDVQPRIIQLHAVKIEHDERDYKVLNVCSSVLSGATSVSPKITEITGLTLEDLVGKPTWEDIRTEFFKMCEESDHTVAHNFQFDARMVQVEEKILGKDKPFQGMKTRCSLLTSRKVNKDAKSHALGNLYHHLFGEPMKGAHTADGDVNGLIKVYMDLVSKRAWG